MEVVSNAGNNYDARNSREIHLLPTLGTEIDGICSASPSAVIIISMLNYVVARPFAREIFRWLATAIGLHSSFPPTVYRKRDI